MSAGAAGTASQFPPRWLARPRGPTLLDIAVGLERLGFDTLWLSELESDPPRAATPWPFAALSGSSPLGSGWWRCSTRGARLPTVTAKAAAGADRMCGGRLGLGLGDGRGHRRGASLARRKGTAQPARAHRVRSRSGWLATAACRQSAAAGCGWFLGWNHGVDRVVQAVHRLEEECDAQGRDPRSIRVAVGATRRRTPTDAAEDARIGGSASDWAGQWVAGNGRDRAVTDLVCRSHRGHSDGEPNRLAEIWATEVLGVASHRWRLRWG